MRIAYDYDEIPHQKTFHLSTKPKVYLSTGYGGGKTYALVMKMFALMNINRGMPGGLLVPNIKMYKRDVLPTIMEVIRTNGIRYKYNKSELHWLFAATGSEVWVYHSEDEGQSIRGPTLGWFAMNEITLCSEQAYLACLGRLRHPRAKLLQTIMSGTPEGFNWTYNRLIENPPKDLDLIFGDARDNKFIHPSYFTNLEGDYDEQMQAMYIGGQFVNLSGGRAFYGFDRRVHTSPEITRIPELPVLVALDFNVSPMAASLCNIVTVQRRSGDPLVGLRIFDEINLKGRSDTWAVAKEIKKRLDIPNTTSFDEVTIYPDPSGGAGRTSSRHTDIEILELEGFKNIKYKRAPSVRDSVNAVNNMFAKGMIQINPKCRNVIADFEQCIFKKNEFVLDKSDINRTHWADGIRYLIEYEFPIHKRKPARTATYL